MRKASRRVVNRRLLFLLAFAVLAAGVLEYRIARVSKGVAFVMKMGSGWNIANTLDAHGLGKDAGTPETYETYWGRPSVTPEMVDAIADAGFDTLRIPVTWFEHMDDQNQIDGIRMDRVQRIVDLA
ncbi:MAG TPA: cellulase family glycosylhydrolase, partial [Clostridia bacterium]|nr:cellulase family glycosylhydrolase [Clostridia bacterium]